MGKPWEQGKLKELAIFNPKEELPDVFEYVDLESVVGTVMQSHRTETKQSAPSRAQRVAHPGDLFYQTVRPYQKNNYLFERTDKYYVFSTGYAQLRPLIYGYFLLSLVQNELFIDTVLNRCTGTSYPAINSNDLAEIKVLFPHDKEEQEKIGSFFRSLDNLILLHQHQLNLLKEQKKGLLQKMFPREGSNVPELRFPEFTDSWEQRKLESLCKITTGKLDANAMVPNGKFDFYTSGIAKYKINTPAFSGPAITIAGNGATVGYMHLADGKFNAYQRTYVLLDFRADRKYLYMEIGLKLPNKIATEVRAGSIPYLVLDMLSNLMIDLPTQKEQEKIGEFFSSFDNLITLHQRKLELLKEQKKGLLQKMFPKEGEDAPELRFPEFR